MRANECFLSYVYVYFSRCNSAVLSLIYAWLNNSLINKKLTLYIRHNIVSIFDQFATKTLLCIVKQHTALLRYWMNHEPMIQWLVHRRRLHLLLKAQSFGAALNDTRRWIRVLSSETIGLKKQKNKCICFISKCSRSAMHVPDFSK